MVDKTKHLTVTNIHDSSSFTAFQISRHSDNGVHSIRYTGYPQFAAFLFTAYYQRGGRPICTWSILRRYHFASYFLLPITIPTILFSSHLHYPFSSIHDDITSGGSWVLYSSIAQEERATTFYFSSHAHNEHDRTDT